MDFIVSQYWLELVVSTLIEGNQRAEWTGCCKQKHWVPIGPAEKWTRPLFLIGQMLLSCSLGGNWKRHADSSPWDINRNQISEVKLKLVILFPLHKNRKWMVVGAKTHFLIYQRLQMVLVWYFHYSNYFVGIVRKVSLQINSHFSAWFPMVLLRHIFSTVMIILIANTDIIPLLRLLIPMIYIQFVPYRW